VSADTAIPRFTAGAPGEAQAWLRTGSVDLVRVGSKQVCPPGSTRPDGCSSTTDSGNRAGRRNRLHALGRQRWKSDTKCARSASADRATDREARRSARRAQGEGEPSCGLYQLRGRVDPFGTKRHLEGTIKRIRERIDEAPAGARFAVRGKDDWPRAAIRKALISDGPEVVQIALSQLGVDYVWGDEDPKGTPGAGFDCSGLVKWCFAQVEVNFPHKADLIMRDGAVQTFSERGSLRPGNLIFYEYGGGLEPGQADHIGIFAGDGMQIDASTNRDEVVHREVDWDNVLTFGNVAAVTGPS
jgi:cell wall-associated NlpC family hydrolase